MTILPQFAKSLIDENWSVRVTDQEVVFTIGEGDAAVTRTLSKADFVNMDRHEVGTIALEAAAEYRRATEEP